MAQGVPFLLVSTVFYAPITDFLLARQPAESPLLFWELEWALRAVQAIFIVVGLFLAAFGIAFNWLKKSLV